MQYYMKKEGKYDGINSISALKWEVKEAISNIIEITLRVFETVSKLMFWSLGFSSVK